MNKIDVQDGKFVLTFDYDPRLVEAVKAIPGRRFQNVQGRRSWVVPASSVDYLAKVAKDCGFTASQAAKDLAKATRAMVVSSSAAKSDTEVAGLGGTLRPFQSAGVEYALKAQRTFIADEMGLGKTVEALAAVQAAQAFPVLVICPATLKLNWQREARKWLPGRTTELMGASVPKADVVIVNYDILRKVKAQLIGFGFQTVILDESHYVKNYKAQRSVVAKAIADQAKLRLALTGTPLLNRPYELVSQLQVLDRLTDMGGFWPFVTRYCNAKKTRFGWDFSGAQNLGELNERLRSCCYIRRKKVDVLPELPDKVRSVIPVDLSNLEEYQAAEADLKAFLKDFQSVSDEDIAKKMRAEQLVKIEVTKQIAAKGKLEAVVEWVTSFLETGEKLVLFAHHQSVVHKLGDTFSAPVITGETPLKQRQAIVDRFQTDPACPLIVCNIQAGGLGITLTAASNVAFVELGWTPAVHDQAEDRCHRIGQKSSVNAWYFLANGTVDEIIYDLIAQKREVVDGATEGGGSDGIVNELTLRILDESRAIKSQVAQTIAPKPRPARKSKASAAKPVESAPLFSDPISRGRLIQQALLAMYRRQTLDEQGDHKTTYQNTRGFNGVDAAFGTSLAEQVMKGKGLSDRQYRAAEKMLKKYRKQLKEDGIQL
jgi:SNF2 family DNA or RNA helicase